MFAFTVPAEVYDRYFARYSREIAPRFAAFAGTPALARGPVLDVGCGTGALAVWLARQFGGAAVSAIDPSEAFAAVVRERVPGADVRVASAEALPFRDATFEAALAQLVLSFVPDAPRAAAEMRRVVRPGGVVAACSFEANGFGASRAFWDAALRLDPAAPDEARRPLRRAEDLVRLWSEAGLRDVTAAEFGIDADYDSFDELWGTFVHGIGPAGVWLERQPEDRRAALREACLDVLGRPAGGFTLGARVVAVRGRV